MQMSFNPDPENFLADLEEVGATMCQVLDRDTALGIAAAVASYPFTKRAERYGPRGVFQNFFSCEEEEVPPESPVRLLSRLMTCFLLTGLHIGEEADGPPLFSSSLVLNDHLLLRYPVQHGVALGAHRDYSGYVNLIVSVTLSGSAVFNIHRALGERPRVSFHTVPGMAVFMRAPGFRGGGEEIRPFHSIEQVSADRISLILKQKRG